LPQLHYDYDVLLDAIPQLFFQTKAARKKSFCAAPNKIERKIEG
jgi:hypothetical protein